MSVAAEKNSNSNEIITNSEVKDGKDYYFDSYSHFGIHEEMLKDEVRTRAYMNSIVKNKHLFAGKVVLDVGCGTGILCMFAAKAGASKVIGVECASIYNQAIKIVQDNGLSDTITLIKGKLEEITLPVEKVDIIISEWMGYFLLYESMLDTVLFARNKWLAPDGLIFPDIATIHVAALEDGDYRENKLNWWDNVHGFNMSSIKQLALLEPLVDSCHSKQVMSNSDQLTYIDIYKVKREDLDFTSNFKLVMERDDYLHGLVCWFDVVFGATKDKLAFSTGPHSKYTHWKQTVFYLEEPIVAYKGEVLEGTIKVSRNAVNPRDLDILLSVDFKGKYPYQKLNRLYRLR